MATKKKKEEEPEEEVQEVVPELVVEQPPTEPWRLSATDPVKEKVKQIQDLFAEINQVEGIPFDPKNTDHLIIAAWMVGRGGWLRK